MKDENLYDVSKSKISSISSTYSMEGEAKNENNSNQVIYLD